MSGMLLNMLVGVANCGITAGRWRLWPRAWSTDRDKVEGVERGVAGWGGHFHVRAARGTADTYANRGVCACILPSALSKRDVHVRRK